MSQKSVSSAASERSVPSIKADLTTTKLTDVKGERQDQFKKAEKANNSPHLYLNDAASSHMYLNVDTASLTSPPIDSLPPPTDKKSVKAWPAVRSTKNVHRSESVTLTTERNHKPKHHQHRHHHCSSRKRRHSCHRRHSYQPRSKSNEGQHNQSTHSSPKVIIPNSTTDASQQPVLVYRRILNNKGQTISLPLDANGDASTMLDNQQKPLVVYRDSSVQPNTEINTNSSKIAQQCDPFVCLPQQQQQQQQILLYTEPATSNCNFVQQVSCSPQQQQYVYVDSSPSTIVSQVPTCSPISTTTQSQAYLCVPQTSPSSPTQILIQQQPQTTTQSFQIIQTPQVQTGQILKVTPAAPVLASIQPQIIQTIQTPTQAVAASPQILYQRPYDPVVLQLDSQQVSIANSPVATLSQPCYVPQKRVTVGPRLFQNALARTVSDRTGVPVCFPPSTNVPADISAILSPGRRLASTAKGPNNPFNTPNCSIM